jgi:hypothetical protein
VLTVSPFLSFPPVALCSFFEAHYTLHSPRTGDEDNGEQGAWFVLSALGLFSTVPGSPLLVLGSPIFRHVRIWRGKCDAGGVECDYRDNSSGDMDAVDKNLKEGNTPHTFPPDSSYLDVVALGTSASVCKVAEITFNGASLPLSGPGSSSLRRDSGAYHLLAYAEFFSIRRRLASRLTLFICCRCHFYVYLSLCFPLIYFARCVISGPNMATVAGSLLQRDGVLRFVMDGEMANGALPVFVRSSSAASISSGAEGPGLQGQRSGFTSHHVGEKRHKGVWR